MPTYLSNSKDYFDDSITIVWDGDEKPNEDDDYLSGFVEQGYEITNVTVPTTFKGMKNYGIVTMKKTE